MILNRRLFLAMFSAAFAAQNLRAKTSEGGCSAIFAADIHHGDIDSEGIKKYRESLAKVSKMRLAQKDSGCAFLVNLGDAVDRNHKDWPPLLAEFDKFGIPVKHVLGNHDFICSPAVQKKTVKMLCGESGYYSFDVGNWRFAVLDCMRLSKISKIKNAACAAEFEKVYPPLAASKAPNSPAWGGGIDAEQREWLDRLLARADSERKNVAVISHMMVYPVCEGSIYNPDDIGKILASHESAKIFIAGHYHRSVLQERDGVEYLTLAAMIGNDEQTYSRLDFSDSLVMVKGFGAEISREIPLRGFKKRL